MSQRQCLPIEDDDSDTDSEINFNLDQISAHKYLKSVRLEREKTKEIVSVEVPDNCNIQNEMVNKLNKYTLPKIKKKKCLFHFRCKDL